MKHLLLFTMYVSAVGSLLQAQQFQNLLQNPGAHDTTTNGWTIDVSGGDGWAIHASEGNEGTPCWTGSFSLSTKSQTIDLVGIGYNTTLLDQAPIVIFSEKYRGRGSGGTTDDFYQLRIELRDAAGNVIDNFDTGQIMTPSEWTTIQGTFRDYGPGLRYIYYEHSSVDGDFWAGNYGAQIDASHLSILNNVTYAGGKTFDFSGWEIDNNGGDGWIVTGNGYYRTSYATCTKHQVIDLMALGYTKAELDFNPRIDFGEFILGVGPNHADVHTLKVELWDSTQSVIKSFEQQTTATDQWQWVGSFFDGYGQGLRYIYFEHSGIDAEYWAGHYGLEIDYSFVQLEDVDPWPTDIHDQLGGLSMQLYPNPSTDHAVLELKNVNLNDVRISIASLTGQVFYEEFLGDIQTEKKIQPLVFPNLANGVYLVRLSSTQGTQTTKLVIQK